MKQKVPPDMLKKLPGLLRSTIDSSDYEFLQGLAVREHQVTQAHRDTMAIAQQRWEEQCRQEVLRHMEGLPRGQSLDTLTKMVYARIRRRGGRARKATVKRYLKELLYGNAQQ